MKKLDELINELCPDGVEYKKLEDCCNILDKKRKPITKSQRISGEYAYYGANGIQDYVSDYIFNGTYILVGEDGSVITPKGTPVVNWAVGKIWVNNHAHIVEEKSGVLLRFLYHYIQTVNVFPLIHGNIPKLNQTDFRNIKVPVPPIEVQEEIVKILDNFTELTSELTSELTARKQQYEYYRDYLLSFDDEDVEKVIPDIDCSKVEKIKLCDISSIERGKRVVRNELSQENGYPVYQNSLTPLGYYTDANRNANTVYVIGAGAAGEIGFSNEEYWAADDCFTFSCNEKLDQRYLYFWLMSKQSYIKNNVRKSSIPRLPRNTLENLMISLPPIDVQRNIVQILDRFDMLCNGISEGIPAEIEARKQQYEYYRDTLLSFNQEQCSQIVNVERERERERESKTQ